MSVNYKKLFSIQKIKEIEIKKICPYVNNESGIYIFTRTDDEGRYAYIGKSKHLLQRLVSHLLGYKQAIDVSLKKRGFYGENNELGWKLICLNFPEHLLDDHERYYIDLYRKQGYQMYNVESGGTIGKTLINERKSSKTYQDGLKQGEKRMLNRIREYFDKYISISIKESPNKLKLRKYNEFIEMVYGETDNGETNH